MCSHSPNMYTLQHPTALMHDKKQTEKSTASGSYGKKKKKEEKKIARDAQLLYLSEGRLFI